MSLASPALAGGYFAPPGKPLVIQNQVYLPAIIYKGLIFFFCVTTKQFICDQCLRLYTSLTNLILHNLIFLLKLKL